MFIVLLNYIQPLSAIEVHLDEHRRFLDGRHATGHFLASGPQLPRTGGVILAKAASLRELCDVLLEDSFYQEHVVSYGVIEFEPTKFGTGLEALLATPPVE
ncbi:YciI family protein [Paraburkholderia silvatlantica]|uniref:Uncharacterized protein YciI n=1 Tax=Paraburkholderia silvatlantica TaxID=321895 RepID=A0ABR6FLT2_9BURK|nr:YciI family protein [Paraburkholderia silvatlantica]MBB2928003.1 uncharacterized protein YciI [Paraburkholderia silvatlantica]PVY17624.1 uncharacterized protein YciI [Paraburkholderia silvatlantica]PXW23536.1 uncharacterized protein YciI [Paraburkholderia silvatlantica]